VNDLFFIGAVGLNLICESTSRVYFWLELTMSTMTSILTWVGLILSACILAYFMIILSGFVLVLWGKVHMRSVLFFDAGATAGNILKTGLLSANHVKDLTEVVSLFIAFNIVYLLLCDHVWSRIWIFFIIYNSVIWSLMHSIKDFIFKPKFKTYL